MNNIFVIILLAAGPIKVSDDGDCSRPCGSDAPSESLSKKLTNSPQQRPGSSKYTSRRRS